MREQWRRSEERPKFRRKNKGHRGRLRDDVERAGTGDTARRSGRKRQLEELTEFELDRMLDTVDQGETAAE